MSQQILVEAPVEEIRVQLAEGSTPGRKVIFLEGAFGVVDKPTANGRVYSSSIIQAQIDRLGKYMSRRALFGEVDHPSTAQVSLMNAGTLIESLRIDPDGIVRGKMRILDGDYGPGDKLRSLVDHGVSLGVSSRGTGSVVKDGSRHIVQSDFYLSAFDVVAVPAFDGAYPSVRTESINGGVEDLRIEAFSFDRINNHGDSMSNQNAHSNVKPDSQSESNRHQQALRADEAIEAARMRGYEAGLNEGRSKTLAESSQQDMQRLQADNKVLSEQLSGANMKVEIIESELTQIKASSLKGMVESELRRHLPFVVESDREAFKNLIPQWSSVTDFDSFKSALDCVVEDFKRTDRYLDLDEDGLAESVINALDNEAYLSESVELLEFARAAIVDLREQAAYAANLDESLDLLSNAHAHISLLSVEHLKTQTALDEAIDLIESLEADVDTLKKERRSLRNEAKSALSDLEALRLENEQLIESSKQYKHMVSESKLMSESVKALEESALESKNQALELELEKYKAVIGSPNPITMLEHLSKASNAQEVPLLAEQYRGQRTRQHSRPGGLTSTGHSILNEENMGDLGNVMQALNSRSPKALSDEHQSTLSEGFGNNARLEDTSKYGASLNDLSAIMRLSAKN